jgi:hypothetical protein
LANLGRSGTFQVPFQGLRSRAARSSLTLIVVPVSISWFHGFPLEPGPPRNRAAIANRSSASCLRPSNVSAFAQFS